MNHDPIGGEHYHTMYESGFNRGGAVSLHAMILSGEDMQHDHYHPPGLRNLSETSMRVVMLYPLKDPSLPDDQQGIEFTHFEIKDTQTILPENADFPHVVGDIHSSKKTLRLKPGQLGLVSFGKGVHSFKGSALALSLHFFDADNARRGFGSFLGNTAGYEGNQPNQSDMIQLIKPPSPDVRSSGGVILPTANDVLASNFNAHANISKSTLIAHQENTPASALSDNGLADLVAELINIPSLRAA